MELRESIAESSYYSISRIMKIKRGGFIPWEKQTDKVKKTHYKEADLTLALFKQAGYHLVPELPVLSDEEMQKVINKTVEDYNAHRAEGTYRCLTYERRAVAQAQLEDCIRRIKGE